MALSSLRVRRTLSLTSSLLKTHRSVSALKSSSSSSILQSNIFLPSSTLANVPINPKNIQSHLFHSSIPSLSSRSYNNNDNDDKIGPDTILFEGCDYMHWLITMDFPKDPAPSAEEMVETYVQTLAKVVGSVEEAKKRMYACSTTTYQGFQAVMTEEMSEKFRGLPGVVFILPDSYIDPKNKEYGGDKYINGEIIHRPPPAVYGSQQERRYNRDRERTPRYGRPMQQGDRPHDRQSPMQGDGRNQPNDPQGITPRDQQFDRQAPMQGGGRNTGPQQGYPPQPNYEQGGRQQPNFGQPMSGQQPMAVQQPNIGQPMAGHPPHYGQAAGEQPNYGQPAGQPNYGQPAWQQPNYGQAAAQQPNFVGGVRDQPNFGQAAAQQPNFVGGARDQPNYGQAAGQQSNFGQAAAQQPNYVGGARGQYGQASGQQSNFGQMAGQQPNHGYAPIPGERVDALPLGGRGFAPADDRGNYAPQQRREYAPVEHRGFGGDDRNFSPSPRGGFGQGEASGFGQGYSGSGAGQTFPAAQSNNMQEEQRGYTGQQGRTGIK
ncbi:hypothetical protein MKX01_026081 [Papaver californicum]|nr:hypothetical protein MKX01_026081 [Papaver californicum]